MSQFKIESVRILDKGHETLRHAASKNAVAYDLMIDCKRTEDAVALPTGASDPKWVVEDFLRRHIPSLPVEHHRERDERMLYSRLIRAYLTEYHLLVDVDFPEFRTMLARLAENRAGYWFMPNEPLPVQSRKALQSTTNSTTSPAANRGSGASAYLAAALTVLQSSPDPLNFHEVFAQAVAKGLLTEGEHDPDGIRRALSKAVTSRHPGIRRVSRGCYVWCGTLRMEQLDMFEDYPPDQW